MLAPALTGVLQGGVGEEKGSLVPWVALGMCLHCGCRRQGSHGGIPPPPTGSQDSADNWPLEVSQLGFCFSFQVFLKWSLSPKMEENEVGMLSGAGVGA
jgi:hypothetical protein